MVPRYSMDKTFDMCNQNNKLLLQIIHVIYKIYWTCVYEISLLEEMSS